MRYYLLNFFLGRAAAAVVLDLVAFALAAVLAWVWFDPPFPRGTYVVATMGAGLTSFVLLYYTDAYRLTTLGQTRATLGSLIAASGAAAALLLGLHLAFGLTPTVLENAAHLAGVYVPLLLGGRFVFRVLSAQPALTTRVLVIGTSDLARAIAAAMRRHEHLGAEIVGFLSDDPNDHGDWIEGYPVIGWVHEVEKLLERQRIDRVVVASKRREERFPADELLAAKVGGLPVESGVAFYERLTGRIYLRDLRASYLIFTGGFRTGPLVEMAKRVLDVTLSGVGLLLASPLLLAGILAVRLDSRGPIFYSQLRVGRRGRPFRLYKLRSMRCDAERDTGAVWTGSDDDRITRVGRLLRKARLDELPQLWNILRGDMSLVGPRPERPEFVDSLKERYPYFRLRTAVRPGLTGWAQIRQGYVNDVAAWEDKLALDLYYMKYRSFTMDLLILWNTLKTLVLLRGH